MSIELSPTSVPAMNSLFRLQFEKAQDSWVLLYPEGMVKLNQSAAEIMQRCDGQKSIADIVAELEEAFESEVLISDVTGFVDVAVQQNWLKINEPA
ncbi:MAG: pyrroloquinoline quinone biosynthesis peptide chaperone PqqD [Granulosicoccus sp.]